MQHSKIKEGYVVVEKHRKKNEGERGVDCSESLHLSFRSAVGTVCWHGKKRVHGPATRVRSRYKGTVPLHDPPPSLSHTQLIRENKTTAWNAPIFQVQLNLLERWTVWPLLVICAYVSRFSLGCLGPAVVGVVAVGGGLFVKGDLSVAVVPASLVVLGRCLRVSGSRWTLSRFGFRIGSWKTSVPFPAPCTGQCMGAVVDGGVCCGR